MFKDNQAQAVQEITKCLCLIFSMKLKKCFRPLLGPYTGTLTGNPCWDPHQDPSCNPYTPHPHWVLKRVLASSKRFTNRFIKVPKS